MAKKLTTEEFILKAKIVHKDKYDYSKVIYNKNNEKIIIICNKHGEFEQFPSIHLSNHGCIKCGYESMVKNNINNKSKIFINDQGNELKKCNTCDKDKELNCFYKDKSKKNGISSQCKECVCINSKKYKQNNLEISREKNRNYERKNKDKAKIRNKKWYAKNREIAIKKSANWKNENRERYRELSRENVKIKRKTCLKFLIKDKMRSLLRRCRVNKNDRTHNMLGYTWELLKKRLECQFTDGMSWSNYGEWHIDHKKPVSAFDLNTPAHIINALCNLQPLWATTREINGIIYEGNLNKQNNFK